MEKVKRKKNSEDSNKEKLEGGYRRGLRRSRFPPPYLSSIICHMSAPGIASAGSPSSLRYVPSIYR